MKFQRRVRFRPRVEIIPMIDVMFFLVVFFMLFATFRATQAGINVDLPRAVSGTPQESQEIVVSISRAGQLYYGEHLVTRTELEGRLRDALGRDPTRVVIIHADRTVKYDEVVNVMDLVRRSGGFRLALSVDEPAR